MNQDSTKPLALIAEDDRVFADIIRMALVRAGFEVDVRFNGKDALTAATEKCYDVVSSDYQMPQLNGEQLLQAIVQETASRNAALILCSAKCYEMDSERLREQLGLKAIFYKPFSVAQLASTAIQAIQRTAGPQQTGVPGLIKPMAQPTAMHAVELG